MLLRTVLDKRTTYIREMRRILIELGKDNVLLFIPFTYEDIVFAYQEFNDIPMYIAPLLSPDKTLTLVNSVQKMITTRYHSLIFSILSEKPVFVITYFNKLTSLASEEFQDIEWVDINDFPEGYTPRFNTPVSIMREVKNKMRQRALRNIDVVMEHYRNL